MIAQHQNALFNHTGRLQYLTLICHYPQTPETPSIRLTLDSAKTIRHFSDRLLVWFKDDQYIDKAISFYTNGSIALINCFSEANAYHHSEVHGPSVEFALDGTVTRRKWYVNDREVTEGNYAKAAATDPTLPPYYSDVTRYKEFVTSNIEALVAKYSTAPRVKIPLEFDDKGEPVLTPQKPVAEVKKP